MASIATTTHLPPLGGHVREEVGRELQATLIELIDLALWGKQLHWTVFGAGEAQQ
jgi:DNA-binding ferritin-like protein